MRPPQARPAAIATRYHYAPNLVSLAVVVIISADRVKSVVLMVVVRFHDRVHVVQTLNVQVGINVVAIIVVQ